MCAISHQWAAAVGSVRTQHKKQRADSTVGTFSEHAHSTHSAKFTHVHANRVNARSTSYSLPRKKTARFRRNSSAVQLQEIVSVEPCPQKKRNNAHIQQVNTAGDTTLRGGAPHPQQQLALQTVSQDIHRGNQNQRKLHGHLVYPCTQHPRTRQQDLPQLSRSNQI